jgi:uncharacterized ubiquitin-like protein YukD
VSESAVVHLRVQVVDMESHTLDLQVPLYLPARDLTQRIARDAGLEAYWPDGRRRLYWLRARGRLVGEDEKLESLGVIDGELVYLLPEPPAGSGVMEQPPEYPRTHDYAGAGFLNLFASLGGVAAWAIGWGIALVHSRSLGVVLLPGLALGMLCASLGRHAWGGRASRVRVAATALLLQMLTTGVAFLTPFIASRVQDGAVPLGIVEVLRDAIPGLILGFAGVFFGWLAWWGAVEELPPAEVQAADAPAPQMAATVSCGVCGMPVDPAVRSECAYGCGTFFHAGCHRAKTAVYRGPKSQCAVCLRPVSA